MFASSIKKNMQNEKDKPVHKEDILTTLKEKAEKLIGTINRIESESNVFDMDKLNKRLRELSKEKETNPKEFEFAQNQYLMQVIDYIISIYKEENKKLLFITHDGFEVFEGHKGFIYIYDKHTGVSVRNFIDSIRDKNNSSLIFFNLPKNLEEYILMNKPLLSLSDLLSVWSDRGEEENKVFINRHKDSPLYKNFLKLAQSKLNDK